MMLIGLGILILAGLASLGRGGKGAMVRAMTVMASLALFGAALALASRGVLVTAVPAAALAAGLLYSQRSDVPRQSKGRSDTGRKPKGRSREMESTEALSILGLGETAKAAEIERAYRQRMRTAHPDAGGSHDMAAQLNVARSVLLRRLSI